MLGTLDFSIQKTKNIISAILFPRLLACSLPPSQVSVATLVFVDDVSTAAQLLAHVGDLLTQRRVLPLQERRPDRDLVLLEPPRVPGPLGGLVVFHPSAPVLLVLLLVGHQHLPGLFDHGLRFELLVGEAVSPGVEGVLSRHAGQSQVGRVGVKVHHDVGAAVGARGGARGAGRSWGARGGRGLVLRH